MSNPGPSQLHDPERYEQLASLHHDEVAPFVQAYYFGSRTWITLGHMALSLLVLAATTLSGLLGELGFSGWLALVGWAVVFQFLVIPVHEALHALAYRLLGARDIRFGGSLRMLYFYAVAHLFVVDRRQFTLVALAPSLVINGLLLLGLVIWPAWAAFFWAALFIHVISAAGDVALLNYAWLHRRRPWYTYDDAEGHLSYFFAGRERAEADVGGAFDARPQGR